MWTNRYAAHSVSITDSGSDLAMGWIEIAVGFGLLWLEMFGPVERESAKDCMWLCLGETTQW